MYSLQMKPILRKRDAGSGKHRRYKSISAISLHHKTLYLSEDASWSHPFCYSHLAVATGTTEKQQQQGVKAAVPSRVNELAIARAQDLVNECLDKLS